MGTIRFHHGNIITSVSYSPDGKRLVSTSPKELKVWDAQTGAELRQISDFKASAFPSVVSPDHRFVAVPHADGIKLLDLGSSRDRLILSPAGIHLKKTRLDAGLEAISPSIAFSPDSKLLAGADWDGVLGLWDTHTGEPVRTLRRSSSSPSHIAFSPDGKTIA